MTPADLTRRTLVAGAGGLLAPAGFARAEAASDCAFLVVGDWGRRGNATQRAVAAQMARRARSLNSNFVVTVGDNFYTSGVRSLESAHWRQSFLDVYDMDALPIWYPALGNHDYLGDPDIQVAYAELSAHWRMPSRYYRKTVIAGPDCTIDLFILDTYPIADPEGHRRPAAEVRAQWNWFDREAATSRADWKIVFGHHPLRTSGWQAREYPYLRRWLAPRLELYNVQAYVAGHDHHLEHIQARGVAHIITGGGAEGEPLAAKKVRGHRQGWATPGFTSFQVAGDVMTVTFIDAKGRDLGAARIDKRSGRSGLDHS